MGLEIITIGRYFFDNRRDKLAIENSLIFIKL